MNSQQFALELEKLALIAEAHDMEFEGGRNISQNLRDMAQSLFMPSCPETLEDQAKMTSFGGRLGGMVVEFSETMTPDQQAEVLTQLDETTDQAFSGAARDLALMLNLFANGENFPKEGQ